MSLQHRGVLTRIRRLFSPSEQLEAEDLQEQARDCGASPLSECCDRAKVRIRGTVSSVTKLETGGVEALLTDGTGSIELNWTGRRRLDCITPRVQRRGPRPDRLRGPRARDVQPRVRHRWLGEPVC